MSKYTIRGEAKGVQVQDLRKWYTDFRGDDTQILDREGVNMRGATTLYRNVAKDGDRVHIDQAFQARKRRAEMSIDITLHPENLTYDAAVEMRMGTKQFIRDTRRYGFTQGPDGGPSRGERRRPAAHVRSTAGGRHTPEGIPAGHGRVPPRRAKGVGGTALRLE